MQRMMSCRRTCAHERSQHAEHGQLFPFIYHPFSPHLHGVLFFSFLLALVTTSPAKQTLTHHLWCAAQNSYQRCLSSFRHVRLQIVRHDIFPKSRGTERWLPCCCSRWRPSHQGMQNWPPWEQVRVVIIFAASPNFCPIFIPLRELFDFCLKVPYLTQISHFLT